MAHAKSRLARDEGQTSSALAERAALDRAQTSRAWWVDWSRRAYCGARRRRATGVKAVLQLTEPGRALYAALLPRVARINRDLLSTLSEAEVTVLEDLLRRCAHGPRAWRTDRRRERGTPIRRKRAHRM